MTLRRGLTAPATHRRKFGRTTDRFSIWLTGVTLSIALLMITGLIGLILVRGLRTFWPVPLWEVTLADGTRHLGLRHSAERIPDETDAAPRTRTPASC